MAYSEDLADRVRAQLVGEKDVLEREAFGMFEVSAGGNMACRVAGDSLVVRVGPDLHHDALTREHTVEFVEGGVGKKGWIEVAPAGLADDDSLHLWVRLGLMYARTQPAKPAALKAAKKAARQAAAARRATKKAATRASKKAARAPVKQSSKKRAKKSAKNSAKKAGKRTATRGAPRSGARPGGARAGAKQVAKKAPAKKVATRTSARKSSPAKAAVVKKGGGTRAAPARRAAPKAAKRSGRR